jgi:hypothetical protein
VHGISTDFYFISRLQFNGGALGSHHLLIPFASA